MRILLINPNRKTLFGRQPLGLLQVGTVCQAAGHYVEIYDADLYDKDAAGIWEYIESTGQNFDLIGIGAMTPLIMEALEIAETIKEKSPASKVILGGPHATIFPEECSKLRVFDAVVTREGEYAILEIINDIENDRPLKPIYDVPGIVDLDSLPTPDYRLIDYRNYHPRYPHGQYGLWATATTSRGCPNQCSFCSKSVHGNRYRAMSPARVISLIAHLNKELKVREITFYDDLFTLDKERLRMICYEIINSYMRFHWECESHVNIADEVEMNWMREAGCHTIYYGIESGSQKILDAIHKNTTLDRIRQAVESTRNAGIRVAGYFIFGAPGETPETIAETFAFLEELKLDHAQFSVCCPLPGSELYDWYIKVRPFAENNWDIYQYLGNTDFPAVISSEQISWAEIENAVKRGNEKYYGQKNP